MSDVQDMLPQIIVSCPYPYPYPPTASTSLILPYPVVRSQYLASNLRACPSRTPYAWPTIRPSPILIPLLHSSDPIDSNIIVHASNLIPSDSSRLSNSRQTYGPFTFSRAIALINQSINQSINHALSLVGMQADQRAQTISLIESVLETQPSPAQPSRLP